MPASWKIAGSYFEACNCEVACPCVFTSPPTSGECTVLIAWHIDHGSFGETGGVEQEWILFAVRLRVCVNQHIL
ncbi:MAG: DUF1326 domain-containing protein [Verrucomicrobia bacterium]|jgi:hypothetical protein|nr:DUF1326 domain-containing protein [Verrucomicrobiota bacterium]